MSQAVEFLLNKDKVAIANDLALQQKLNLGKEAVLLDQKIELGAIEIYNAKYQECLLKTKIQQVEAEIESTRQNTANAKTQADLTTKQIAKTDSEIKLYKQKTKTEEAQIWDKVDGISVGGVTGIQKEMYRNQSNGYLRLAEQQYARLMLDAFAVLQSNAGLDNFETDIRDWGVDGPAVKAAVDRLAAGITAQGDEHTTKATTKTGQPAAVSYTEKPPATVSSLSDLTVCAVTVPDV